MKDIFDRLRENPGPLGQFADYAEGYFVFPKLEGPIGPRMKFQGREVIFGVPTIIWDFVTIQKF